MDDLRLIYEAMKVTDDISPRMDELITQIEKIPTITLEKQAKIKVGSRITQGSIICKLSKSKEYFFSLIVGKDSAKFRPYDLTKGTYTKYFDEVKKDVWDSEIKSNDDLVKLVDKLTKNWKTVIENGSPEFQKSMNNKL